MNLDELHRINVVGTGGSGKSTFGKRVAQILGALYISVDELFWKPNWEESPDEELFSRLSKELEQKKWILDGNYTRTTSIKWKNVQTVIWLDYSFRITFFRVFKRSMHRIWTKTELWPGTGNVESFRRAFFTKQSMLYWVLKTYKNNRFKYNGIISDPRFSHIHFIRLSSPKQAEMFLKELVKLTGKKI